MTGFIHTAFLRLLFFISLCISAFTANAEEVSINDSLIQSIFPKATLIGDKQTDVPVQPVYQLQELLGYVFASNDLVNLPGFSGTRINLLIGIDTAGNVKGIRIINHHEPIFLHGLGPGHRQED